MKYCVQIVLILGWTSVNCQIYTLNYVEGEPESFFEDSKGFTWIGSNEELIRTTGAEIFKYRVNRLDPKALQESEIQYTFLEDNESNIWFVTPKYLHRYDRLRDCFEHFSIDENEDRYYRLVEFLDNKTLLVQYGFSLYSFDLESKDWNELFVGFYGIFFSATRNEQNEITTIYGTRWLDNGGLYKLNFHQNNPTSLDSILLPFNTRVVSRAGEVSWIASKQGLIRMQKNEAYDLIKGPRIRKVTDLIAMSDYVCFFVNDGSIFKYNHIERAISQVQTDGLSDFGKMGRLKNGKFVAVSKSKGVILFLKRKNPTWYFPSENSGHLFKTPNILQNGLNLFIFGPDSIYIQDSLGKTKWTYNQKASYDAPVIFNNFIFCTDEFGVLQFEIKKDSLKFLNRVNIPRIVTQIVPESPNQIMIGTNSGILRYRFDSGEFLEEKLIGIYVQSFAIDNNGYIWAGSNSGLYYHTEKDHIFHFEELNGLPGQRFLRNQVFKNKNGKLHFGLNNGVLSFYPDSIPIEKYEPNLILTSLKVNDLEWAFDTLNIEELDGVSLRYDENSIRLTVSAIDLNQQSHPKYKVFLQGHDDDTISLGFANYHSYSNLRPGKYTYHYSVCNLTGICRSKYETFDITINPPYWETWWFRSAMVLLGLGIISGGIRLYIRNRLREQQFAFEKQELYLKNQLQLQEERNRIADELHDELGGKLSTIRFAGRKVERAGSLVEVKKINKRVSEISTELIDSMRSIIWAMDSHNDSLKSLWANIRSYASNLAQDNDINIRIDFPSPISEVSVKGQIRHHLYLAIKEILNNILKHSNGDQVILTSKYEYDLLTFSIKENGVGFDPERIEKHGSGLRSIRKRMKVLNGTISYHHGDMFETRLILNLP